MKNKNIPRTLVLIMVLMLGILLSSCAASAKSPDDLIKEKFSGKEFTISFNSESLDKPLEDMTYSANAIPKLPVPQKVGYIFEGWFFDKEFTQPYADAALKLSMQDVTLYPKWNKEKFEHNGTYAIEFDAKIVEGTVNKGKTTDVYGGYDDFSKAIMKSECQIEKSDDKLLLKIQYDSGALTPFFTNGQVYAVSVNEKMGTDIYIKDVIDSAADKIKTIFIKIDKWNLSTTMYLDVMWINYHDDRGVNENNRYDTLTSYEVAIDLTKIIGFEEAFADPKMPLEEGYYLAKSYFRKENNESSMGAIFNPVYSYIYSDGNEHYKLIKQNLPYLGLVAGIHPLYDPITENYYERMMCFVSLVMAFDIDNAYSRDVVKSDYYPEIYNGGYYRRSVTEFHADEGKYYNIIDLDKDLTKEYIALTAVSGFMEVADGMGYIRQIMSIDYDNLIKLPECDYKPLSGDFYEYEGGFNFYPGGIKDLNKYNLLEDAINDNGMSIEMPNFYYERTADDKQKVLSFSMEVTPTRETSAFRLADSRNKIGEFNVNNRVFGYDVRDGGKLYLDRMNPQAFSDVGYNNQLRDVTRIKTGTDIKKGTTIDLEELYREKVNNDREFLSAKYTAYEINNNKIDFSKPVIIGKKFKFVRDIAIEFTYTDEIGVSKTIVELKDIADPIFTVWDEYKWTQGEDYHFTKTVETSIGKKVYYPQLTYYWGEETYKFVQNFYLDEDTKKTSINPARTMRFSNSDTRHILELTVSHTNMFTITDENMSIVYEMQNEFRERKNVYFDYINKPRDAYIINDDLDNTLLKADVKYRDKDGIKIKVPADNEVTMYVIYGKFGLDEIRNYTHTEDGYTDDYVFKGYSVFSNNGKIENQSPDLSEVMLSNINAFLEDKDYGVVHFHYIHGEDELVTKYLYKITFSGEKDFNVMTKSTYFSNVEYKIDKNFLVGGNMKKISNINLSVQKWVDGRPSNNWADNDSCRPRDEGMQYSLTFLYPGDYMVSVSYDIKNSVLEVDDGWATSYRFGVLVNVKSNVGNVKITYKTDAKHPFKGGLLEKTVIANLGDGITTLGINSFDEFEGVNKPDGLYRWINNDGTYSQEYNPNALILGNEFIDRFGSDEVTFVAKWEHKFTIECDINGNITKTSAFMEYGRYTVRFPAVREGQIPNGYAFVGWNGGILGNKIHAYNTVALSFRPDYDTPENFPEDYFKVKAVFKKIYKVHFEVNIAIADPVKSTTAVDGFKMDNATDKYLIQVNDRSYKFVGWKLKGTSETLTKKQFIDYIITGDTVFEAVFEKKGVTP